MQLTPRKEGASAGARPSHHNRGPRDEDEKNAQLRSPRDERGEEAKELRQSASVESRAALHLQGLAMAQELCETVSTQTDWTGGWENIPGLAFLGPGTSSFPFWAANLAPFAIPPPPPSEHYAAGNVHLEQSSPLAAVTGATLQGSARPNGVNQFQGNHSFLGGMHLDRSEQAAPDTGSEEDEDEDECDAFEYEVNERALIPFLTLTVANQDRALPR